MDAAIRKAKDSLGTIFDKNLTDLVRGIRNHKENEAKYIAECIDEIKQELKQDNIAMKANAINKLCYLQMLGYDISWASFNVIEVMSSTRFTHKRIGYLTASQCFHEGTDVLMLTTNMIRKDLGSQNMYEAGVALSGLSCFLTPDLARDLANEIMTLMTANKPYIRKKAVLIMYKIFLKYPDALRPSFPRLKEKLDDPDPSVQAAAVNVICELARKNPKNYLSLAPIFFKLMTQSSNNWVLIKIIKLFGALTPLEPRLGQKLIEPLTNLINSTSAMSLLYECINTVLAVLVSISSGQPNHNTAIEICLQKLRILIEDSDQNLKYLGLLAMSKILQTNPKAVQTHKDLIMQCLDDKDESIRLRALDLLYGMVSKKNLMEIIKKLMVHMNKAEGSHYRDELLAKIVDICSQNNYQYVTNFEWYVSVLVELTRMEGTRHGKLLSSQMLDVAIRVESIRPFIVGQMAILLDNIHVFTAMSTNGIVSGSNKRNADGTNPSDICEVLYSATWICGEFAKHLESPLNTMEAMLKSKVTNLPGHIQVSFVHNVFKLYAHIINILYKSQLDDDDENNKSDEASTFKLSEENLQECKRLTQFVTDKLQQFEQNADIEVQERTCSILQILKYLQKMLDKTGEEGSEDLELRIDVELACLFEGELNPVAAKAQRKVPLPEGLNLDEWINDPPSEDEEVESANADKQMFAAANNNNNKYKLPQTFTSLSSSTSFNGSYGGGDGDSYNRNQQSVGAKKLQPELSEEELNKARESRRIQVESNPFYIKSSGVKKSESNTLFNNSMNNSTSIPDSMRSQSIDLKAPLNIPGVTSSDSYYRMSQIDQENKKLKKKMKEKLKGGEKDKKKKKKNAEVEEEDEEDLPTIKVLKNEMPEGVADDTDDEDKKKDPKDPHRALDINLDEPLKEEEKLRSPAHRNANMLPSSESKQQISPVPEHPKEDAKKSSKKSSSKSGDKKEKEKSKKKDKESGESTKEKKKSKKKSNRSTSDNMDLLIEADLPARSGEDYSELLSPENDGKDSNDNNNSKGSDELAAKATPENQARHTPTNNNNKQSDDLDFWLSTDAKPAVDSRAQDSEPVPKDEELKSKSKKKDESDSKKEKKSKKDKDEKKSKEKSSKEKSSKKEKKESSSKKDQNYSNMEDDENDGHDEERRDHLTEKPKKNKHKDERYAFQSLASNKHIQMSYSVRPNLMNLNQVIVTIQIKMASAVASDASKNPQIFSIELNLLDTATVKLIRDENKSPTSESIRLPFSLTSKSDTNQIDYYFVVTDTSAPKKLKGNITYMLKDDVDGSLQDKIDFKLSLNCSHFLVPSQCDNDDFVKWLSSGNLSGKNIVKFEPSNEYDGIEAVVNRLTSKYCLTTVEMIDNSASLFISTMQNQAICILIKQLNDGQLSIDGKSTSQQLVEAIIDEFKEALTS